MDRVQSNMLTVLQGTGPVLPWFPSGLRHVEYGSGVRAGRRADDLASQLAAAVLCTGLPRPITALLVAGHQHRLFL